MAIFGRNKVNQAGMAPEVNDFYKAEGRERTFLAWIMAIGTLLVTIAVVLGVFYGGRWAYRKLNNNKKTPVAVQTDGKSTNEPQVSSTTTNIPNSSSSGQTQSSSTASNSTSSSTPSGSNSSTESAPATTSTSPRTTKSDLPNTGPGDTFAIFAAVSVFAYLIHRLYLSESK